MKYIFPFCLITLSLFVSTLLLASDVQPQLVQKKLSIKPIFHQVNKQKNKQYIVVLEDEPVIKKTRLQVQNESTPKNASSVFANSSTNSPVTNNSVASNLVETSVLSSYKKILLEKRESFVADVRKKQADIRVLKQYSSLVNGVAIETKLAVKELNKLANVKAVYPVRRYKRKMENVLPIIKATDAWSLLGGKDNSGDGIKIAIIDSGIVVDHPMFSDIGMAAPSTNDLPTDDYCRTTDSGFCNNKIIAARYYVPDFINLNTSGEFNSPQGLSGHGSHVAGIAAGRQVSGPDGEVLSGVAPGAYLMVYKTLWGQDGEGTDVELLSAIEDAMRDGADVINNSWGGNNGGHPSSSLYQDIYAELEQNGVVVVTAAGNEGDTGSQSISCPGCIESGITVGATTTDLSRGLPITYDGQTLYGEPSDSFAINTEIALSVELAPSNNALGCTAWPENSLIDKIVVVTRGTCFFEEKANLAKEAGAEALIVINNESEVNITMSMGSATLPAVLISESDGATFTNAITNNDELIVTIGTHYVVTVNTELQDWVADFSSLGPNGDNSFIKPDISAPGVGILSATASTDNTSLNEDYARNNGTSMATPAVAGAAALLKQFTPTLSALDIKRILINSADSVVKNTTGEADATAFETGSGRLNVLSALQATTFANQPNMVSTTCVLECELVNELSTLSSQNSTWTALVAFDNSMISAQVIPNQISLTASQKNAEFAVEIQAPLNLEQGWYFGRLQWSDGQGKTINQAIAINNEQVDSELLQLAIIEQSDLSQSIELTSYNVSSDETLDVEFSIEGNGGFKSNSLLINGDNSHQIVLESTQKISIEARVNKGVNDISSAQVPIVVNLAEDNVSPIVCELAACDEVLYEIAFNFKHFSQEYDVFMLSDNGIIIAGDEVLDGSDYSFNLDFPDETAPNNIIAPFWTDFDLSNFQEVNDTGGGEFFVAIYEVVGINYLVIQWNKVKLYLGEGFTSDDLGVSSPDLEFTFQVILQENSENKWFRYLDIPEQPLYYSVGTENNNGTIGEGYWFDGSGTSSVNSGDELSLSLGDIGTMVVNIEVEPLFTQNDTVDVIAGETLTINVLENDIAVNENTRLITSVNDLKQVNELFPRGGAIIPSTIQITSTPVNGQATISTEGLLTYTANESFKGSDKLTYSVENDLGYVSSSVVNIQIELRGDDEETTEESDEDKGFLGLSLSVYLQGLLFLLIVLRRRVYS